jgi:hypothetical protein
LIGILEEDSEDFDEDEDEEEYDDDNLIRGGDDEGAVEGVLSANECEEEEALPLQGDDEEVLSDTDPAAVFDLTMNEESDAMSDNEIFPGGIDVSEETKSERKKKKKGSTPAK